MGDFNTMKVNRRLKEDYFNVFNYTKTPTIKENRLEGTFWACMSFLGFITAFYVAIFAFIVINK